MSFSPVYPIKPKRNTQGKELERVILIESRIDCFLNRCQRKNGYLNHVVDKEELDVEAKASFESR